MGTPREDTVWRALGSALWTAIPVASTVAFVAAALKVFRAAGMETSTTVAILSSADDIQLLKGVLVTLLPGFFTGLLALAIWEWARDLPSTEYTPTTLRNSLVGPRPIAVLILLIIGYFTISVIVWVWIFLAALSLYCAVLSRLFKPSPQKALPHWRTVVVALSSVASVTAVLVLALSSEVWLPLRDVRVVQGHSIVVGTVVVRRHVAAYVLSSDAKTTTLLLDSPRAVVTINTDVIEKNPQICIPTRRGSRTILQRPSQWLGPDGDFVPPYEVCPQTS